MARIAGVDLPREKRVEIGLTYIYGIGRSSSNRILKEAGVNPDTRVKDLTDDEVRKLAAVISDICSAIKNAEEIVKEETATRALNNTPGDQDGNNNAAAEG